jgi:hypothetical protein
VEVAAEQDKINFSRPKEDTLLVSLAGNWTLTEELPSADNVRTQLESGPRVGRITFETQSLKKWDSGLLNFLVKVMGQCSQLKIDADTQGLPQG